MRLIRFEENLGSAQAGQRGISHASGDWVARMDADDLCAPRRIEIQLRIAMKMGPSRIIGSGALLFGEARGFRPKRVTHPQLFSQLAFTSPLIHSSLFSARDSFLRVPYGGSRFAEDHDFLERSTRMGAKLFCVPLPLIRYRVRKDSKGRNGASTDQKREMTGILSRFLSDLAVEASPAELEIYFALAMRDARELPKGCGVTMVKDFSSRLIAANSETRAFPVAYFHQVVRARSSAVISELKKLGGKN